ncbi:hypothetical protein Cni_G03958 [Canna indica]|uniref:Uncharacterized protein n=1 Tax=Canna indica TaxID=4628 RepID=A0AAQ3JSS4_9LILI|nr:hypothetical protein Cni_G03958 [Canna indica]
MSLSSATVPTLTTSANGFRGVPARSVQFSSSSLALPCTKCLPFQHTQTKLEARRLRSRTLICAAALSARCAAEGQTQTVTRQSSTITIAPVQGKEKSPELDDGGTGFPPRDDDGGGGGGGGGGGHWPSEGSRKRGTLQGKQKKILILLQFSLLVTSNTITVEMLEKEQKVFRKKYDAEMEKVKDITRAKNMRAHKQCLKRKRIYEEQIEQFENYRLEIHEQIIMLKGAEVRTKVVDALRIGDSTLEAVQNATLVTKTCNCVFCYCSFE